MNRIRKFQLWDKVNKIMTDNPINCINLSGQILLNDGKFHDIDKTDYILREYTNLKDKNGNEIWEGDVVKSKENYHYIINLDYGSFCAGYIENNVIWRNRAINNFPKFHFEVIGNIYQNPELLNGGEND